MFCLAPGSDPRGLTRGSTDGHRWSKHHPTLMQPRTPPHGLSYPGAWVPTSPRLWGWGCPLPAPLSPAPRAGEMAHVTRRMKAPMTRVGFTQLFATTRLFPAGKLLTQVLPLLPAAQPSTAAGALCNLFPDFHTGSAILDFTGVPPATKSRFLVPGSRSIPAAGQSSSFLSREKAFLVAPIQCGRLPPGRRASLPRSRRGMRGGSRIPAARTWQRLRTNATHPQQLAGTSQQPWHHLPCYARGVLA